MIYHQRPAEPDGFQDDVREAEAHLRRLIESGQTPEFGSDAILVECHKKVREKHGTVFARAQRSKCAFCECPVGSQYPHLDHFAPKAEEHVRSEDPDDWPREIDEEGSLPNVDPGHRNYQVRRPGYWWLAYDWTNYLLACSVCNTAYKKCFFPVRSKRAEDVPPHRHRWEEPLILNPFDEDEQEPWRHFQFDEMGVIQDYSERGRETAITCGLHRPSLLRMRTSIARRAWRFARTYMTTREPAWLRELCDLGNEEAPHAGMVRSIAERAFSEEIPGIRWTHLVALVTAPGSGDPRRAGR